MQQRDQIQSLPNSLRKTGADYIATGHYVRRADVNGKSQLLRGLDGNKDQSYFLYTLSHEQIAQSLFPVGELESRKCVRLLKI